MNELKVHIPVFSSGSSAAVLGRTGVASPGPLLTTPGGAMQPPEPAAGDLRVRAAQAKTLDGPSFQPGPGCEFA